MKRIIVVLSLIVFFTPFVSAIEYKKMQFVDAISGETVTEECYYNSKGVLRCKNDTIPYDFEPTKYSYGYDYQNKKSYTIIEKGNNISVYSQGNKIYSQSK